MKITSADMDKEAISGTMADMASGPDATAERRRRRNDAAACSLRTRLVVVIVAEIPTASLFVEEDTALPLSIGATAESVVSSVDAATEAA
jgi:hypothetical protein